MKPDDAMLVRRRWLEEVDAAVFKNKPRADHDDEPRGAARLFYDVRPAILKSAWTASGGRYSATAAFIVNDAPDNAFIFPVYAPTASEDPGGTVDATRFFVIWRGRWELLAGAGAGGGTPVFKQYYTLNNARYLSEPITYISGITATDNKIYFITATTPTETATLKSFVVGIE